MPFGVGIHGDPVQTQHLSADTRSILEAVHERAVELGAQLLHDRSHHAQEPLRVYADLDGHPFCIFVARDETRHNRERPQSVEEA